MFDSNTILRDQILWYQKYRPQNVADTILPSDLSAKFADIVKSKEIPDMIFAGSPGIGKTTVAMALADELGYSVQFLKGSGKHRGIDTVKGLVEQFASTTGWDGARKLIIYDEFDNTTRDAQLALLSTIEQFSETCSFIFTCNAPEKIIEAIHSRAPAVEFRLSKSSLPEIGPKLFKRLTDILQAENVTFDKKDLLELITASFPDIRRVINQMQGSVIDGELKIKHTQVAMTATMEKVVDAMKKKNWQQVRKIVRAEVSDYKAAYEWLFDNTDSMFADAKSEIRANIEIATSVNAYGHSISPEISLCGCLLNIMVKSDWKK